MRRSLCVAVLVACVAISAATECCYQFSSQPTVPRIVWDLGPTAITPLLSVSQRLTSADSAAAVGDCTVLGADVYNMEQKLWLPVDRSHVQRMITITNSQMEFGPLSPGTDDRNYLIANLQGRTVRLALTCADFPRSPSCVLFDLVVRDSTDSAQVSLQLDTANPRNPCARSASPTSSLTPSITRTPSMTPSQSPTAAPSYGTMYRWRLQADGAWLDLELAFSDDDVQACNGKLRVGSANSAPLLLELADMAHNWSPLARRHIKAAEYYQQQSTPVTVQSVSLVWANGGYCRFAVYLDGKRPAEVSACRVYDAADAEHRFNGPVAGEPLDYQFHQLCVGDPSPSPTPNPTQRVVSASPSGRPITCSAQLPLAGIYRAMRGTNSIIELKLRPVACTDEITRYSIACATRLHVVGSPELVQEPQFDAPDSLGLVRGVSWGTDLRLDLVSSGNGVQLVMSDSAFQIDQTRLADSLSMIWPCQTP